jgi:homopolymeric O-antigen transport system ATP-binding protein
MSQPAIEIQSLSKQYRIGATANRIHRSSWSEAVVASLRSPWRAIRERQDRRRPPTIWALRDVSMEIRPGEVLGIIGPNGAGKSTLLRIVSGITEPTAGRVVVRGRMASLLEVGTGFHSDLTGRENVYLNGVILGMQPREIRRKFDAIVAFAEVEKFIDTPVKYYSSGMYVRLAFAVAAHLDPDILLVDEVLAVGDAAFQKRCLGKMEDVTSKQGRTILFVSHNMSALRALCKRACLIDEGRLLMDGDAAQVISSYLTGMAAGEATEQGQVFCQGADERPIGTGELVLQGVRLVGPTGQTQSTFEADQPIQVEIYYEIRTVLRGARINLWVLTQEGEVAFISTDHDRREEAEQPGQYRSRCVIPGGLLNRTRYTLSLDVDVPLPEARELVPRRDWVHFTVSGRGNQGSTVEETWPGAVCPRLDWHVEAIPDPVPFFAGGTVKSETVMR